MTQKTALLAHDHAELDQLLAAFFAALSAHEIEQSFAKLDLFWARLAMHIRAEHLHLFPTLLRALENTPPGNDRPSLQEGRSTISRLQEDHDFFMRELAAAVREVGKLRAGAEEARSVDITEVQKQVIGVSRRLETHNELEESRVYPLAEAILAPAERISLNEKMQKELGNFPTRFAPANIRPLKYEHPDGTH